MSVYDNDKDYENVLLNRGYFKNEEYWVRRELDLVVVNQDKNIVALCSGRYDKKSLKMPILWEVQGLFYFKKYLIL